MIVVAGKANAKKGGVEIMKIVKIIIICLLSLIFISCDGGIALKGNVFEIEKIIITDQLPDNWTYPLIQPKLLEYARNKGFIQIKKSNSVT